MQNTRKYTVRIVRSLLIITGGILADTFNISPPTTFRQPNPQDVDQMITVSTPFPEGFTIILGLALGATIDFYSVYRYSEQTFDPINPTKSRGLYIMLGVILTLLTLGAAIYAYYT
ncbi:MAG: hypothetical protein FJ358_05375 [Thaumarchaeota archaeon]|nr:hypothetical protein [Nitrososphaerota archaeon]